MYTQLELNFEIKGERSSSLYISTSLYLKLRVVIRVFPLEFFFVG